MGRISRRCLHVYDCAPSVCAKDCFGIVKVVVLIFEIIAGPRIRIASSRKVGGYRTVFNSNACYDGIGCKVELFRLECGGFRGRDIRLPEAPAVVIDEAAVLTKALFYFVGLKPRIFVSIVKCRVRRLIDVCLVQRRRAIPHVAQTVEVADGDGGFD